MQIIIYKCVTLATPTGFYKSLLSIEGLCILPRYSNMYAQSIWYHCYGDNDLVQKDYQYEYETCKCRARISLRSEQIPRLDKNTVIEF